jgi:DamX protein
MLDNDGLTYSQPKRPAIPVNSRQSERALITVDRSQKLDLLIHLLTNLQQSLIVCGPDGIGKTTLLKTLESSHSDIWPICTLSASSALSFESAVNHLSRFLELSTSSVTFDLSPIRAYCSKQKVVLAIDDAGELMPGLIGELIDFADSLPGLRLIFALSNDELTAKTGSDAALDDCHLIELPPLNQRQCLEFLQNISAQPDTSLSFGAINDELVEDLYQRTGGIPGKLLAELPKIQHYQSRQQRNLLLWVALSAAWVPAIFAISQWWPSTPSKTPTASDIEQSNAISDHAPPPAPPTGEAIAMDDALVPADELLPDDFMSDDLPYDAELAHETPIGTESEPGSNVVAEPVPAVEETVLAAAEPLSTESAARQSEPQKPANEASSNRASEKATVTPTPAPTVVPTKKPTTATTEAHASDTEWITAQPPGNYTVQVMVLSYKDGITRLKRQYPQYADDLKYYPIGQPGRQKYVILYGSFPSAIEALNTKSDMPGDFTKGLVKSFKYVQRQSQRR